MPLLPYRSDLKYLEAIGIYHLCTVYLGHPFIITAIIMYMAMQMIFWMITFSEAVKTLKTAVAEIIFIMDPQGRRMGYQDIHILFLEKSIGIKPGL